MIKVDIKRFIYDRDWFGYRHRVHWDHYGVSGDGRWIEQWVKI